MSAVNGEGSLKRSSQFTAEVLNDKQPHVLRLCSRRNGLPQRKGHVCAAAIPYTKERQRGNCVYASSSPVLTKFRLLSLKTSVKGSILQRQAAGDTFSQLLFIWKRLYFTFNFEGYIHWIQYFRLAVFLLSPPPQPSALKMLFHCLLASNFLWKFSCQYNWCSRIGHVFLFLGCF